MCLLQLFLVCRYNKNENKNLHAMSCKMLTQQQAKDPRCSSSAASGVQAPCDRLTL